VFHKLALVMTKDNRLNRGTAHPAIAALGLWKDEDEKKKPLLGYGAFQLERKEIRTPQH
jgi:hypothetical protein